jgi:hypothetical protein
VRPGVAGPGGRTEVRSSGLWAPPSRARAWTTLVQPALSGALPRSGSAGDSLCHASCACTPFDIHPASAVGSRPRRRRLDRRSRATPGASQRPLVTLSGALMLWAQHGRASAPGRHRHLRDPPLSGPLRSRSVARRLPPKVGGHNMSPSTNGPAPPVSSGGALGVGLFIGSATSSA